MKLLQILQTPHRKMVVAIMLFFGLCIRLALAPFTSHPYDFASWVSTMERFYNLSISPLYWWKFGTFLNAVFILSYGLYLAFVQAIQTHNVSLLHLILKAPFILADMGIAILLHALVIKTGGSWRQAVAVMSLWLFNPFAIFVSSIHGETDALSVFFVILSIYFLQQSKLVRSFTSLLVGGMFKYYPLLLLPIFVMFSWKQSNRRGKILGLIILITIPFVNFVPLLLDPLSRNRFFSGLTSSVVPSSESFPWSLWVLPWFVGLNLSSLNFSAALFLAVVFFSFWISFARVLVKRKFRLELPDVLRYYLIIIMAFVVLNPISNPQFLLWILPLLLYFSFAMNKEKGFMLAALLLLFNLAALFVSFSPSVYLLDSLQTSVLSAFQWPYVNSAISNVLKAVYSLLLLYTLIEVLTWPTPVLKTMRIRTEPNSQNVVPRVLTRFRNFFGGSRDFAFAMGINVLIVLLFFSLIFYPAWVSTYFLEPAEKPVDLYRLNEIRYSSGPVIASLNNSFFEVSTSVYVDLTSWLQEFGKDYANTSLIFQMKKETSAQLLVSHEKAGNAVLISSGSRIDQIFSLSEANMALKFKLLIGEPQECTKSDLRSLHFSLNRLDGNLIQVFNADQIQRDLVGGGWFFYIFTLVRPLMSGTYNLSASVENSALIWSEQLVPNI
jgi:Gpi18-like mannosyltransferase